MTALEWRPGTWFTEPCWVAGLYCVVQYDGPVGPEFVPYFINEEQLGWGDVVERPCTARGTWRTALDARAACERHAAHYKPTPWQLTCAAIAARKLIGEAAP